MKDWKIHCLAWGSGLAVIYFCKIDDTQLGLTRLSGIVGFILMMGVSFYYFFLKYEATRSKEISALITPVHMSIWLKVEGLKDVLKLDLNEEEKGPEWNILLTGGMVWDKDRKEFQNSLFLSAVIEEGKIRKTNYPERKNIFRIGTEHGYLYGAFSETGSLADLSSSSFEDSNTLLFKFPIYMFNTIAKRFSHSGGMGKIKYIHEMEYDEYIQKLKENDFTDGSSFFQHSNVRIWISEQVLC